MRRMRNLGLNYINQQFLIEKTVSIPMWVFIQKQKSKIKEGQT